MLQPLLDCRSVSVSYQLQNKSALFSERNGGGLQESKFDPRLNLIKWPSQVRVDDTKRKKKKLSSISTPFYRHH